jgi:hypothetical protein
VVAENPIRGLGEAGPLRAAVVLAQPIEAGSCYELPAHRQGWVRSVPLRDSPPNPLVWPCSVEMVDKGHLSPEWLLNRVGRIAENRHEGLRRKKEEARDLFGLGGNRRSSCLDPVGHSLSQNQN